MEELEERIRRRARLLWRRAGSPAGREPEFRAEAEAAERGETQPAEVDEPLDPAKFAGF